ncbi:MAG: flagellar basal-body rod protein FlgF [Rhodopirellula sp.]|nr:flagellar basal-body rod protein FlgF [Rhodopirellula sp.]
MPYGLYLSAEGAHAQAKRLEVVANNLANVDTVGFKRELALFQARYAEAIERGSDTPGSGSIDDLGGGVIVRQTATDYSAGPLKRTMTPTDLAIDGDGFFMVQKDDEVLLTRAGNFQLTADGQLITQQGYPVLNETGSPITIEAANGPWDLSPSGAIRQRGVTQILGIVQPASLGDLAKAGENLFRPLADTEPVATERRHIVNGYLEASAVQPTTELMEMIEASRAVEINMSMMQTQDQMLSGLVNRVLRP